MLHTRQHTIYECIINTWTLNCRSCVAAHTLERGKSILTYVMLLASWVGAGGGGLASVLRREAIAMMEWELFGICFVSVLINWD